MCVPPDGSGLREKACSDNAAYLVAAVIGVSAGDPSVLKPDEDRNLALLPPSSSTSRNRSFSSASRSFLLMSRWKMLWPLWLEIPR